MDTICPVCGVKLVESGGTILCPNRQCRHVSEWSQAAIEQADKTRARLIAEAVKPWRDTVEASDNLLKAELNLRRFWICPECRRLLSSPEDTDMAICGLTHMMTRCVPVYLTRADFESVKATSKEETT